MKWLRTIVVLCCAVTLRAQDHTVFTPGDVFVATVDGKVQWRLANGTLNKILDTGIVNSNIATTAGMAFDACNNLYVTAFNDQNLYIFDQTGSVLGKFGSGYTGLPESVLFDAAGNAYVGQASGFAETNTPILKFTGSGIRLDQFQAEKEDRGTDWIELAADQCTMFYTSEGKRIKRYDVCNDSQLSDFNPTDLPGRFAYALRILPSGGVLVADSEIIVRLDASGNMIQTYDFGTGIDWFALNLDPDGTSFWSGDLTTRNVVKFDIESGAVLLNFNVGSAGGIGGITVNGEITVARPTPPPQPECVTRTARFWFTHPTTNEASCATLQKAIQASCNGRLNLGFIVLPTLPRYSNTTDPFEISLIESLGLYWRSKKRTGEASGTQSLKQPSSALCRVRKQLAGELIAAMANTSLLRTDPANCGFPSDLISRARDVAGSGDIATVRAMTALLRQFNSSGLTNQLPDGLVECTAAKTSVARRLGRDPTTQIDCGLNDSCESADPILSVPTTRNIDLTRMTNGFQSGACGTGGADAIFKLAPPVAATNRHFTVEVSGATFSPLLSVWSGTCSNPTPVTCASGTNSFGSAQVDFRSEGDLMYFIVVEGEAGATGKAKVTFTSP